MTNTKRSQIEEKKNKNRIWSRLFKSSINIVHKNRYALIKHKNA